MPCVLNPPVLLTSGPCVCIKIIVISYVSAIRKWWDRLYLDHILPQLPLLQFMQEFFCANMVLPLWCYKYALVALLGPEKIFQLPIRSFFFTKSMYTTIRFLWSLNWLSSAISRKLCPKRSQNQLQRLSRFFKSLIKINTLYEVLWKCICNIQWLIFQWTHFFEPGINPRHLIRTWVTTISTKVEIILYSLKQSLTAIGRIFL